MAHFAKVENNLVTQVIVAEPEFIATGALRDPAAWIQTSYNTRMSMHFDQNGVPDSQGLRGNYAGIGYTYDAQNDVFYAPQPSEAHVLDTDTWTWWNPTATDPVETKPVKPEIPVVVIEAAAPVVEAPVVIDVPVVEQPVIVEAPTTNS